MSGNLCQAVKQGLHVKNSRDSYRKDAIASKPCSRKDVFCGLILAFAMFKASLTRALSSGGLREDFVSLCCQAL